MPPRIFRPGFATASIPSHARHPGLDPGSKGPFCREDGSSGRKRVEARAILLIAAPIGPRRVGGIPAAGARPEGGSVERIWAANCPQGANEGPAVLGRGIAAM